MKYKLTATGKIESKLQFVKNLKDITGLGLKESKDIADKLMDNFSLLNTTKPVETFIESSYSTEEINRLFETYSMPIKVSSRLEKLAIIMEDKSTKIKTSFYKVISPIILIDDVDQNIELVEDDKVIIINDIVYVKHKEDIEEFSKTTSSKKFIEVNKSIFEKFEI